MGRSRGGLTPRSTRRPTARGLPLELVLTPGRRAIARLAYSCSVGCAPDTIVLADKAYDADWLRRRIEAAGAAPNIPAMVHRRWKPCFSPVLYRARNASSGSSGCSLRATRSTPPTSSPCSSLRLLISGYAIMSLCPNPMPDHAYLRVYGVGDVEVAFVTAYLHDLEHARLLCSTPATLS
jgi:transposase